MSDTYLPAYRIKNLLATAQAMHEEKPKRFHPYDFAPFGNGMVAIAHSVTGRAMGSIDLNIPDVFSNEEKYKGKLGEILAEIQRQDELRHLHKEIDKLRNYPGRFAEESQPIMAEIERLNTL